MANDATAQANWTDERFKHFWRVMAEIFGSPWLDKNGDEPTSTWKDDLVRYTPTQIAKVTQFYRRSAVTYPPNLPEFMRVVREVVGVPGLHCNGGHECKGEVKWRSKHDGLDLCWHHYEQLIAPKVRVDYVRAYDESKRQQGAK